MQQQTQQIDELRDALIGSDTFRRQAAKSIAGFCLIYLSHHFTLEPAIFHKELLQNLSDHELRALLVVGFRGSAKSTFTSLVLPLWAALEHPDKYPFIIPVADTAGQAALNIANIKHELDNNELLRQDYGTLKIIKSNLPVPEWTLESKEEWQSKNLLLNNGVRILARSRGQKMRGLKHRQHRPKLVIIDDPEDLEWVRFLDNRNKTERWLLGEVIPAIDEATGRWVAIGNHLHKDALMARIERKGIAKVLKYALINSEGVCLWPAKYPTQEKIEAKKKELGPIAWQREMLLKVVPEEGQEITEADIHYYDSEPAEAQLGLKGTAVDPAISKKETADPTAMVSGKGCWTPDGRPQLYIQPYPIERRMDVTETIEQAKAIDRQWPGEHIFFVEDVAYQKALIELMVKEGLSVEPVKALTDKRARLKIAGTYIKNGTVLFPRTGCEDLIMQLLDFGIAEHDDLVDALVYLILRMVESGLKMPEVIML